MGVLWSIWLILIPPGYQDILVSVSGGALSPPRVPPYQTWLPVTPANKCADWRDQGQPRYTIYGQLAVVGAVPVPHHIEHLVQLHPIWCRACQTLPMWTTISFSYPGNSIATLILTILATPNHTDHPDANPDQDWRTKKICHLWFLTLIIRANWLIIDQLDSKLLIALDLRRTHKKGSCRENFSSK